MQSAMVAIKWIDSMENRALFRCRVCGRETETRSRYDTNYYVICRGYCPKCGKNLNGDMYPWPKELPDFVKVDMPGQTSLF